MTGTLAIQEHATSKADFVVDVYRDFANLAQSRPAFLEDPCGCDFFSTWTWFENLSRHGIEPGLSKLLVVVSDRKGGGSFCLPLLQRPRGLAAAVGPVLGGLSNYYSSLYGLLGEARRVSVEGLRAAFAHIKRNFRGCSVIDLHPLDSSSAFYQMALAALTAEGYFTDTYFCFGNWYLNVDGRPFQCYEASIASQLRSKRLQKKLARAGEWHIDIYAAPGAALDAAIADFGAVYARSWKTPEPFPEFIAGLCQSAAERGWLRLGVLRVCDRPAAAQIWIVKDRKASIYKLAYDEAFRSLSAGSALTSEMMKRAIDKEQVLEVDYLTGDDGYKADWMSHRRERLGILAFHRFSLPGRLSWLRHLFGRSWRRWKTRPARDSPLRRAS